MGAAFLWEGFHQFAGFFQLSVVLGLPCQQGSIREAPGVCSEEREILVTCLASWNLGSKDKGQTQEGIWGMRILKAARMACLAE